MATKHDYENLLLPTCIELPLRPKELRKKPNGNMLPYPPESRRSCPAELVVAVECAERGGFNGDISE